MDGMNSEEEVTAKDYANDVYDATGELGREIPGNCPAPIAYSILGNLKNSSGHMLEHVLDKLVDGLEQSLIDFDVYDTKREAAVSVATAKLHLERAAGYSKLIAQNLEAAQTAINSQGWREPGDQGYREPEDRE